MLSPTPVNKWHEGLLDLFGYMDGKYWTLLWCLAEKADDKGHVRMSNLDIVQAMAKEYHRTIEDIRKMRGLGLIKLLRRYSARRNFEKGTWELKHCRVIGLYPGIEFGKIPAGAERLTGLAAYWHYQGRNCNIHTHKLIRDKFKPNDPVHNYTNFAGLTRQQYKKVVPSAEYQHQQVRKNAALSYTRRSTELRNRALKFEFL